jgi:hypothetical protein
MLLRVREGNQRGYPRRKPRHRCWVHSSVIPGREQGERARNPLIRGLGGNLWVEIDPSRIAFLDQPDFPIPPPFLQLLLAGNRRRGIIIDSEPDQFVDRISFGETGNGFGLVLVDATNNVIRHAEI